MSENKNFKGKYEVKLEFPEGKAPKMLPLGWRVWIFFGITQCDVCK